MDILAKIGFLLVLVMLLSGCIKMTTEQKLNRDGSSEVIQTIDFTVFVSQASSMQKGFVSSTPGVTVESSDDSYTGSSDPMEKVHSVYEEMCKNLTKKDPSLKCVYDRRGILTISKNILKPDQGKYKFSTRSEFPNIVYVFEIDQLPHISDNYTEMEKSALQNNQFSFSTNYKFTDAKAKLTAASYSMMQATITYIVEMPGTITKATNGEIKDGKAVYDVVKLMQDGKTVHVESAELDVVSVVVVLILAVMLIGGIIFVVLRKRNL